MNGEAPKETSKEFEKQRAKLVFILIGVAIALFALSRAGGDAKTSSCSLSRYRQAATPLMQEFSTIVNSIDLNSAASRDVAQTQLRTLRARAGRVECRHEYPLKQETLEYAINHTLEALTAFDAGDAAGANRSLDFALLNVERFQDWSVDVR